MDSTFVFFTRLTLVELLGRTACNLVELLDGIRTIPDAAIYYHTHRFLQQHHYLSPEPPNDFAFWVTQALGLDALGEKLSSVDIVQFRKLGELREAFVRVLAEHLEKQNPPANVCPEGEEFHFMSCRTFILPTRHEARTLKEFLEVLKTVSVDSLYYHMFESRLHLEKGDNDFSVWFSAMGREKLAQDIARLDPYTITMEGLRLKIIRLVSPYVQD